MNRAGWVGRGAGALLLGSACGAVVACASLTGLNSYSTSCAGDDCDASTGSPAPGNDATTMIPPEASQTLPPEDQGSPPEEAGPAGDDGEGTGDANESPDGTSTATLDSGADVEAADSAPAVEAGHDSGATSSDGGCESTNTVQHCSACGAACATSTGTPSCNGFTCAYSCSPNKVDCNAAVAPDTDGCECAGTACCGTSCQTAHTSGLTTPNAYYNCAVTESSTFGDANAACLGVGGNQCLAQNAVCGAVFGVGGTPTGAVCGIVSSTCYCWVYAGTGAGTVSSVPTGPCTIPCSPSGNDWN